MVYVWAVTSKHYIRVNICKQAEVVLQMDIIDAKCQGCA